MGSLLSNRHLDVGANTERKLAQSPSNDIYDSLQSLRAYLRCRPPDTHLASTIPFYAFHSEVMMNRALCASLTCLALSIGSTAQQSPGSNESLPTAPPLVQIEHLAGDPFVGFTQSCVLMYSDGKYHRETRRQVSIEGHPKPDWLLPEVFENTISAGDLQQLREIVESDDFRTIIGTLGDGSVLRSNLLFWPAGGVTPHADIDFFEASVARSNGPQVFEVLGPISGSPANSLRPFRRWVAAVEKRKEGRVDDGMADSCSARTAFPNGSPSWGPATSLRPRPFYSPSPKCPVEETGHSGKVTIQALINPDGSVGRVSVRHSLNPALDQCALDAVKHWKFVPARLNLIPVPAAIDVEVNFPPITPTLLTSATFASNNEAEAAALIGRAKQLSDIRADGAPPFRLKLDFKIIKDDGAVTDGTYIERWVSKAQWRRETVLGDFTRIQVVTGRKVWLLDSSAVVPQQIGTVPHISHVGGLRPEAWKSQRDREVNGVVVHCLENISPLGATWAVCFDKISGTLTAEISPLDISTGGGERVCLYSDYQKFGEYVVARSYECDENNHPKIEARIVELTTDPAEDPTVFAPPEGAKESVNCLGLVKAPTEVHYQDPKVPRSFRGANTAVTMSVVVGTDGRPHDLRVTSAPNRDYDRAAIAAVQQWRFRPATCDGEPMETQIVIETQFHR